ncbi:fused MFS/spermidine synthase [Micrococcus sp.]|uniref:spermidine synthase n=1 Tax=Micrococcus sp. TaxID=1271 RepID=UPI002A910A67|nr:fused MFS/spermidine synthase [Micrococcus sp.]MDY6055062.1 fused MFS/spermidine synthase [Micrococcus sp.]
MAHHNNAPSPTPRTIHLTVSGEQARILPDELGGVVLEIGGHVQSHVDLDHPEEVRYEYLRRIAAVLDAAAPTGAPLTVLHLGAGALTLPRRVQALRPGSAQTVVDLDPELVDFVLEHLPLPAGTDLVSVTADARAAVDDLLDPLEGESEAGTFDAVVLDIYTGEGTAEHLTGAGFLGELLALLTPGGVLCVNVGDDDGLAFLGTQIRALGQACAEAGVPGPWTLADAGMLDRLTLGNAVLVAGGLLAQLDPAALRSAGPHPAAVLDEDASTALAARTAASARTGRG